jgi:Outer membrane protein beta-barrel domain
MKSLRAVLSATALLAFAAPAMRAQIIIEPMVGGYVPASNVNQVQGSATDIAKTRDGTLSLGLNLGLGMFRGSLAYASGTTIKNASKQDIGKGNVLAAAADLVIRPLPRILVQPYLLAGAGEKFYKYDQSTLFASGSSDQDFAFHGGIGADATLGSLGVVAELTDFLSKGADSKWNVHDAFLMVGLRVPIGP